VAAGGHAHFPAIGGLEAQVTLGDAADLVLAVVVPVVLIRHTLTRFHVSVGPPSIQWRMW
jgi:hypothetical protein